MAVASQQRGIAFAAYLHRTQSARLACQVAKPGKGTCTGIVDVLTVAAADKSEKVQRRAAAALGELLFYISDKDPSAGDS
jgi:hypothetical protein